jgi:hypothetical protein
MIYHKSRADFESWLYADMKAHCKSHDFPPAKEVISEWDRGKAIKSEFAWFARWTTIDTVNPIMMLYRPCIVRVSMREDPFANAHDAHGKILDDFAAAIANDLETRLTRPANER